MMHGKTDFGVCHDTEIQNKVSELKGIRIDISMNKNHLTRQAFLSWNSCIPRAQSSYYFVYLSCYYQCS
jgi:hypothetical protein